MFYWRLFILMASLSIIKSQRVFHDNVETNNFSEKIYFTGKTNKDEVDLIRLGSALANSYINQQNSDHIHIKIEDNSSASKQNSYSIPSSTRTPTPARRESASNINTNAVNFHNSPSSRNRAKDRLLNSSEEPRRRKATTSSSSNRRNSLQDSSEETKIVHSRRTSSSRTNSNANSFNGSPSSSEESDEIITTSLSSSSSNRRNRIRNSNKQTSRNRNAASINSSVSSLKTGTDGVHNSIEKSDGRTTQSLSLSMSKRNPMQKTNEEIKRIPPPSVVDTALKLRVCEIKYAEFIQRIFPHESDTASDANDEEYNGRVLAEPGQYPHMTALGFLARNGRLDFKCGGSLISENFVITAAHCTNLTGLQPTRVRIGDLNLMVEEKFLEPQIRYIKHVYVHPEYTSSSYYNDIALLELTEEIELTEFVRPIRLWTKPTIPFTTAYAMGYGATDFARKRTNRLTNLNMTIVPNEICDREMPKMPQTERGIISSLICCRDYELNRDTCQGDSGGPLQLNIRGRRSQNRLHYQLIGITSYGLHCRSSYPSVYTRVYSYLDWIERIVWRDYFQ